MGKEVWASIRARTVAANLSIGLLLGVGMILAPSASAAPTAVSSCQTLSAPGAYALTADLATVDATCIEITASDVRLDLAGHAISCTGSGFEGSCQVATIGPTAVSLVADLNGVVVKGPGTIRGFDNGVRIAESNAQVNELTITGPPGCDPATCSRPTSNGIVAHGPLDGNGVPTGVGLAGVNLARNNVSNYQFGIRMLSVNCPSGDVGCAINANTVRDNSCNGVHVIGDGYTLTRNVASSNSSSPCFPAGGLILSGGGNTVTNNDSSNNFGFGIAAGPGANGNLIANNKARGNTAVDLRAFPGTVNTWLDNNRCNTESGAVPSSVCNPGE
jgi:parallel beta-helix repeat protein